ncbi:MAG: apolipoprotein N-acyltransferase [Syntrophorhabdaceae bacterium]|nr:apolipoprotein N-acyltransferase [Syntrophorhabdaceae bacterium]
MVLSHSPISLFPVSFVSLVPLLVSLRKEDPSHNFKIGLISGITAYLGIIYWVTVAMNRYGGLDIFTSITVMLLLVLYMALYVGIFSWVITFFEMKYSFPIILSAPFVWVILEYIRGFFLSGFPWALLAYSQHNFLPFIQIISITGVYFISFLIVAVNCIFFHIWTKKKVPVIYTLIVAALITTSIIYGVTRLNSDNKGIERKSVAIIQGNIRQDIKWDEAFKAKTVDKYIKMTTEHARGSDIVIWPETSMPFAFNTAKKIQEVLKSLAISINSFLLFGTVHMEDGDKFYNSAYLIDRQGNISGFYNKVHLVPFGEYTPLKKYIPFLEKITAAGGNFTPGKSHTPIKSPIGNIGVLICYEGIFPEISVDTVRNGAQLIVNLTNDAWYDRTSAPFQHLIFYIFRAIETERYVLRAANTGISAIIDTRGRIYLKTNIFEDDILKGDFYLYKNRTFYVKYGDWFILISFICFFILLVVFLMVYLIKQKR